MIEITSDLELAVARRIFIPAITAMAMQCAGTTAWTSRTFVRECIFSNLDELEKTESGRENNRVFFRPHEAWSTHHLVTVSLHRREPGTILVRVELFDIKFVACGKVNVAAPEVSAPPKSSIA